MIIAITQKRAQVVEDRQSAATAERIAHRYSWGCACYWSSAGHPAGERDRASDADKGGGVFLGALMASHHLLDLGTPAGRPLPAPERNWAVLGSTLVGQAAAAVH